MNSKSLIRSLASYYPKSIRSRGDYGGLMAGKLKPEIKKILLCLDFDDEVLPTALKEKPDLIISHHPFIYGTPARVLKRDPIKAELFKKVIDNDLAVYSFHTNFDTGKEGMNDALARKLELLNIRQLEGDKMARGGELAKSMEVHEFAKYAKEKLDVPYGKLIAKGKQMINSVAIIGGGGWFRNELAQLEGYDIFISGDVPHHGRRDVILRKYNYLDLPHEIENVFMEQMKKTLLSIDPTLNVVTIKHEEPAELI